MNDGLLVKALIATQESDNRLMAEYFDKGAAAKFNNQPLSDCPFQLDSLAGQWWVAGYERG